MKRLLLVQPYGERGGAEVVMLNLLRHLDRGRWSPEVVMLAEGPLRRELEALAGPVTVIPTGRVRQPHRYLPAVMRLAALMDRVDADLVVTSCTTGHAYGGAAAAWSRRPEIWHEHGGTVDTPLASFAARVPSRMFIANSQWTETQWLGAFPDLAGLPRAVVHPGVDVAGFDRTVDREGVRARLGVPAAAVAAVMSGRLQHWKGQDIFLEALALARTREPALVGVILGSEMFGRDAGFGERLRRRAAAPDLDGAVIFAGFQADVPAILPAMDIAVHCSRDPEPFGQVVFEAMAAGLPVIAAPAGGPEEVIQSGIDGLLVRPEAELVAAALVRLAADPGLRRDFGAAGRALVAHDVTAGGMTRQYEAAWDRALGGAAD